ncbi:MAG TPA: hypothetical protein VGO56_18810 [Pyrinomonadaceae bacterium]|jgi:hypothetical protein|nr:hypothetical protein [Pyrinomonadaceae bacterium]
MRRFLMIIALTSLLSVPTLAGEIPTGGAPNPPPPERTTQPTNATSPGEIPCGFAEQISEAGISGLLAVLGLVV